MAADLRTWTGPLQTSALWKLGLHRTLSGLADPEPEHWQNCWLTCYSIHTVFMSNEEETYAPLNVAYHIPEFVLEFVYALHLQCVVFTRYPSCACTVYPMLPLNWRQVDLFRLHYCIQNWFGFSSCWLTDVFMWCSKSQKVQGYSSKTEQ